MNSPGRDGDASWGQASWGRPFPATALLALLCFSCGSEEPPRPNVLLISIDSLRADHLSCYGYPSATRRPTSPNIDELAEGGVLFENAVSTTSWTLPSHQALFSGLPDVAHGAWLDPFLPTPDRVVLPKVLQEHGYDTAGFYSGLYLDPRYGFGEGFDEYQPAQKLSDAMSQAQKEYSYHKASTADEISELGITFLEQRTEGQPFFLFLHYFDVHYDYLPPNPDWVNRFTPEGYRPAFFPDDFMENPAINPAMSAADRRYLLSNYDGEIAWVDEEIGRVLAALEDEGLADNTLVVLVSDHGDEFFEHGEKGHRKSLYEETLRIPLIMRWPEGLTPGRVSQRASIVDVAPSILDMTGVRPASTNGSGAGMWGTSLRSAIDGESAPKPAVGFLYDNQDKNRPIARWSLWLGRYKVVVEYHLENTEIGWQAIERRGSVFDLATDPGEQDSVLERHFVRRGGIWEAAAERNPDSNQKMDVENAIRAYDRVYHGQLGDLSRKLRAGGRVTFANDKVLERNRELLEDLGYVDGGTPAGPEPNAATGHVADDLPPIPKFPLR